MMKLAADLNVCSFLCSSSSSKPASMRRHLVGDRSSPGEKRKVDLHRLYEEGGGQIGDLCGLVLPPKGRQLMDSCRVLLQNC